jgi:phenylalanyl-tRNA synthetase alpha chain
MLEKLDSIHKSATEEINSASNIEELKAIELRYLGKKGEITQVLSNLRSLGPDEKKSLGQKGNEIKTKLAALLEDKFNVLDAGNESEASFDVTLPAKSVLKGGLHPITRVCYDLNEAFMAMGFDIYDGPEISSEIFDFDFLNFPADHPARESMDTYWLAGTDNKKGAERLALRPHLTGGSVRYMLEHKPPFRFVYPGRVYRSEATDASHERAFFQYEALIVEKIVPFSSVRILVDAILGTVFGKKVVTRMRSGFFPFVEPGFEIDMQCQVCEGKGCSVCGQVGWLEVMPGGPPHPNVLKAGGIDPAEWQGAYINIGLDRLAMMKYGIKDVRLFHSGDLRFLSQFRCRD